MGQKNFTTCKKFKRGEVAERHLRHAMRIETQRDLPKNPDGSPMISLFGDTEKFNKQLSTKPAQKHCKTSYYEVMGYAGAEEQIESIRKGLQEKYNREVLAVLHNDEAQPHTHFIIPWAGDDGKSLRLKISDFFDDSKKVSKVLGQEQTEKGQGRRSMSQREYYSAIKDNKMNEKIEELEKEREEKIERKNTIETPVTDKHEEKKFTLPVVPSILPAISPIAPPVKSVKSAAELIEEGKTRGMLPIVASVIAVGAGVAKELLKIMQEIKAEELFKNNSDFVYEAKSPEGEHTRPRDWRQMALNQNSSEAEIQKWAKWIEKKRNEGCEVYPVKVTIDWGTGVTPVSELQVTNLKKNLAELRGRWWYVAELGDRRVRPKNMKPMDKNSSEEELQGWIKWREDKKKNGWKVKMVESRNKPPQVEKTTTARQIKNAFDKTTAQMLSGKKAEPGKMQQPAQPAWLIQNSEVKR
jgi:hypothetical protein